jgi:hypothetical protein
MNGNGTLHFRSCHICGGGNAAASCSIADSVRQQYFGSDAAAMFRRLFCRVILKQNPAAGSGNK